VINQFQGLLIGVGILEKRKETQATEIYLENFNRSLNNKASQYRSMLNIIDRDPLIMMRTLHVHPVSVKTWEILASAHEIIDDQDCDSADLAILSALHWHVIGIKDDAHICLTGRVQPDLDMNNNRIIVGGIGGIPDKLEAFVKFAEESCLDDCSTRLFFVYVHENHFPECDKLTHEEWEKEKTAALGRCPNLRILDFTGGTSLEDVFDSVQACFTPLERRPNIIIGEPIQSVEPEKSIEEAGLPDSDLPPLRESAMANRQGKNRKTRRIVLACFSAVLFFSAALLFIYQFVPHLRFSSPPGAAILVWKGNKAPDPSLFPNVKRMIHSGNDPVEIIWFSPEKRMIETILGDKFSIPYRVKDVMIRVAAALIQDEQEESGKLTATGMKSGVAVNYFPLQFDKIGVWEEAMLPQVKPEHDVGILFRNGWNHPSLDPKYAINPGSISMIYSQMHSLHWSDRMGRYDMLLALRGSTRPAIMAVPGSEAVYIDAIRVKY